MTKRRELALLFLRKAQEDEEVVFRVPDEILSADSVFGFHAQQAAEKMLKAILTDRGVEFRRTHQIRELLERLAQDGVELPQDLVDIDELTPFAVEYRYDDVPVVEEPPLERDRIRSKIASLRRWAESLLPSDPSKS